MGDSFQESKLFSLKGVSCSAGDVIGTKPGRGRPQHLREPHLWLGLLWAVLEGLGGYRALTRSLATHALGRFAPVSITDSALLQRLQQAATAPWQALFATLGSRVQTVLSPPACTLAPFATHLIALDETKLDAVIRRLPWQRQPQVGHAARLAGKLAALFDIRQQRRLRLHDVADAVRNCKQEILPLLAGLPWHSLLLFDLGDRAQLRLDQSLSREDLLATPACLLSTRPALGRWGLARLGSCRRCASISLRKQAALVLIRKAR